MHFHCLASNRRPIVWITLNEQEKKKQQVFETETQVSNSTCFDHYGRRILVMWLGFTYRSPSVFELHQSICTQHIRIIFSF